MAISLSPVFPGKITNKATNIAGLTGPATVEIYSAPSEGALVKSIWLVNRTATAFGVSIEAYDGTTWIRLGSYSAPGGVTGQELCNVIQMPKQDDVNGFMLAGSGKLRLAVDNLQAIPSPVNVWVTAAEYVYQGS